MRTRGALVLVLAPFLSPAFAVATSGTTPEPTSIDVASFATCSAEGVWQAMGSDNAPSPRTGATAVWSGSKLILWGGSDANGPSDMGGRYDPALDAWYPISRINAPSARREHVAVWTGSRMIVWGGYGASLVSPMNSGGMYDPLTDTWTAIDSTTAPSARFGSTAVWTGTQLVVWGGYDGHAPLDSGGRYDPANNTWSAVGTAGDPPPAMSGHAAVWTGTSMIVYKGPGSGARYTPSCDSWVRVASTDAPALQGGAVWTGSSLIAGTSLYIPDVNRDGDGDGWTPCDGDCSDARAFIRPGVADVCNGIDDDCSGLIDDGGAALCADGESCTSDLCGASRGCMNPASPDGSICSDGNVCTAGDACLAGVCEPGPPRDADGDGHTDSACGGDDCSDTDAGAWRPPYPIAAMTASGTALSWEDQGPQAGPGTVYDLYSGTLSSTGHLDFAVGSCLMTGGPPLFSLTGPDPVPGAAFWYLARSRNGCGTSTWGSAGADTRIPSCP